MPRGGVVLMRTGGMLSRKQTALNIPNGGIFGQETAANRAGGGNRPGDLPTAGMLCFDSASASKKRYAQYCMNDAEYRMLLQYFR